MCVSGSTVYTCMLNERGGVESDLTVSRLEPSPAHLPLTPESNGKQHMRFILFRVTELMCNRMLEKVLSVSSACVEFIFTSLSMFVRPQGDAYYLAIGGGVAQHNWSHIQAVLQDQGFRCTLIDHTEDMGMISIQGPKRLA